MTNSRIVLRLALGILCGVALVTLPAVFSTGTSSANYHTTAGNLGALNHSAQPTQSPLYGLNSAGAGGLSFLAIILFIFLPSTIFSLLVRRWAVKRARDYL